MALLNGRRGLQSNTNYPRNRVGTGLCREITMPQSASSYKAKLVGRTVIVKVSLFSRAFRGTITAVDDTGFGFDSGDIIAALREITGSAMNEMDAPNVYLPFSTLEWLVSSEPKASAASA
jgi:hypothetical protein